MAEVGTEKIIKPIFLDETGHKILEAFERQNSILATMSISGGSQTENVNYQDISRIVRNGYADEVFNIGDQIFSDWTDVSANVNYKIPWDIVYFGEIVTQAGSVLPAMYIQWHYCIPFGVQFDNLEAFYVAENEALPAGTYNIIIGDNWGSNVVLGKSYQFTLTQELPINGQLCGFEYLNGTEPGKWTVKSYVNSKTTTPIETVPVTEGNEGRCLGTMSFAGNDGVLNSMQSVGYGYNHWGKSALRQWLNSALAKGSWWKPQHKWDRPPVELATKAGFMTGFTDDFLSIIKPFRVRTAANTVNDDGAFYDTYDKFFIPSLEEMFIKPQIAGEGEIWPYWKEASKRTTPIPWWTDGAAPITYAINAKTSPQGVRSRSAYRDCSHHTWYVYSTGNVHNHGAYNSLRLSPVTIIY